MDTLTCFTCGVETDNPCDSKGVARLRQCSNKAKVEKRDTFTIPEGHVAVVDAEGRATGETRQAESWADLIFPEKEWKKPLTVEAPVKSDGGSSSYYQLPEGAKELGDLIEHKNMNFNVGNIFKAAYRLGEKDGNDLLYDLNKIVWFANREIAKIKRKRGAKG